MPTTTAETFDATVETIRAEEASVRNLFEGEQRLRDRHAGPEYMSRLARAAEFLSEVYNGRRRMWQLEEAMTASDFPELFGDVLDRQLLGRYQEMPAMWPQVARRSTVPDFRQAKRFAVDGAEGELSEVGERAPIPEDELSESLDTIQVVKYAKALDFSFEQMTNQSLDEFRNAPDRLARGARRTEERKATQLYVGTAGPDGTLYSSSHGPDNNQSNIITNNPALSTEGLQTAFQVLGSMVDEDGEPIVVEAVTLVVPPALEVTAQNILNALSIDVTNQGGTSNQTVRAANWMANRTTLQVNPYIPIIADSNGNTSWFLFGQPGGSRPALDVAFLQGNEMPALFQKAPNARRVGGGEEPFDFEHESIRHKVRHIFGTAQLINTGGWRSTVASDGTGTA